MDDRNVGWTSFEPGGERKKERFSERNIEDVDGVASKHHRVQHEPPPCFVGEHMFN